MSGQVYSGTLGASLLSRLSVFVYFDNRIPLFVCIVLSVCVYEVSPFGCITLLFIDSMVLCDHSTWLCIRYET